MKYKKLSKYHGNLGHKGFIDITCPECLESLTVGHLCWSAIKCINCKKYIEKQDFLIQLKKETR